MKKKYLVERCIHKEDTKIYKEVIKDVVCSTEQKKKIILVKTEMWKYIYELENQKRNK